MDAAVNGNWAGRSVIADRDSCSLAVNLKVETPPVRARHKVLAERDRARAELAGNGAEYCCELLRVRRDDVVGSFGWPRDRRKVGLRDAGADADTENRLIVLVAGPAVRVFGRVGRRHRVGDVIDCRRAAAGTGADTDRWVAVGDHDDNINVRQRSVLQRSVPVC